MTSVPTTMRSLVAPKYCKPDKYEIVELPVPIIKEADDVLIRIHAATILTGDTQFAAGHMRVIGYTPEFPLKLSIAGAGIVAAIGSGVASLKVGDAVYGQYFKRPFIPLTQTGFCSEYALTKASMLVPKPAHISFEDGAALMGTTLTAYQCFRLARSFLNSGDSFEGKTVFIPGALSATGSVGCQLAKKVYGASKVVSTVSTAKVALVEKHLPGIVDQLIDYKTQEVAKEVGRGTVDFVYNTQWQMTSTFPLVRRNGAVVSIASVPPPGTFKEVVGAENVPFWLSWVMSLANWYYHWKLRGTGIKYDFVSGRGDLREDIEAVAELIARGKVKGVTTVVNSEDLDAVRRECGKVFAGKGGFGSLVIKFV